MLRFGVRAAEETRARLHEERRHWKVSFFQVRLRSFLHFHINGAQGLVVSPSFWYPEYRLRTVNWQATRPALLDKSRQS